MYNQIGGLKRKNLQLPHLISLPKCGGNNNPFQHAVSSGHLVFPSRSCSDTPSLVPTRMLACSEKRRACESEEEGERFVRKARAVMERHQRVQPLDRSYVCVCTRALRRLHQQRSDCANKDAIGVLSHLCFNTHATTRVTRVSTYLMTGCGCTFFVAAVINLARARGGRRLR